jgi:hypothetical protein
MGNLTKVISGGQTGVDQAALRAARDYGLAIGGWCPPGSSCESGTIPAEFPLEETPNERSSAAPDVARSQRTEWNVRDSDATLILRPRNATDPGTNWAIRFAIQHGKPLLECDPADQESLKNTREWLRAINIPTLNIAGPSESSVPGIGEQVYAFLVEVFRGGIDHE